MVDLTTTNIWLGILAIVSLIQFAMICAAGVLGYRLYQKAMTTIETVERVHIAPLHARVDGLLNDVQHITDKVKYTQDAVSDTFRQVAGTGNAVAWALRARTWPILGILQGLKSVASTVIRNGRKEHADSSYGAM
jgi:hypothetical protein